MAGFTSISEKLSPEELVELLNAYLSEMTDIILATGGTLDKYEGDAIIAFWNAPLDQPDHALRACRAALAMPEAAGRARAGVRRRYGERRSSMRIGIQLRAGRRRQHGLAQAVRLHGDGRHDEPGLAARGRLQAIRTSVLIGEETRARSVEDAILAREIDMIRVVGKKRPVRDLRARRRSGRRLAADDIGEARGLRARARQAYRAREWDAAAAPFRRFPDDAAAAIYIERCRLFQGSPPPADWDGVFDLEGEIGEGPSWTFNSGASGGRSRRRGRTRRDTAGTRRALRSCPASGEIIVVDAGTGIKDLGDCLIREPDAGDPSGSRSS